MVRTWHEFPPLALFWLLANSNQCEWQSKWIYESRPPNKRKTSLPGYKDKSLLWNKVALCLFRQQRGIAVRRRLHPPTLPSSFFIYYLLSSCKRRNYRIRNEGDGLQVGSSFWLRLQLRTSSNAIASKLQSYSHRRPFVWLFRFRKSAPFFWNKCTKAHFVMFLPSLFSKTTNQDLYRVFLYVELIRFIFCI